MKKIFKSWINKNNKNEKNINMNLNLNKIIMIFCVIILIISKFTVNALFDECEKIDEDCPKGCIGYEGKINFIALLNISPLHFK